MEKTPTWKCKNYNKKLNNLANFKKNKIEKRDTKDFSCYVCMKSAHFAKDCHCCKDKEEQSKKKDVDMFRRA
jgi:hypothetical protein